MIAAAPPRPSLIHFDEFVALPENAEKLFEFIQGEIVEVPSNPYSSQVASRVNYHLYGYVDQHDLGHVTGEAGGYQVFGERYAPDVAFISKTRQAELPAQGYNPLPPDLAVEVVSSETAEEQRRLSFKISNYMAAGVVVWVIYPQHKEVEVHSPHQAAKILYLEDTLEGQGALTGFRLPVKAIFPT
jgi:Uma2 family endonuclease